MVKETLILRIGLAVVLIYAGVKILMDPFSWIGFVPDWVTFLAAKESFLKLHGIIEIVLGLGLLSGFYPAVFSGLTFLDFVSILIFYGIDDVVFRDIGLAAAALALLLMVKKK